jgi:succinyl-diaminopimelate desuccinylase
LRAAREDYGAVVELTRALVRAPSRGGIDPYEPVLECMSAWLGEHGLACRRAALGGCAVPAFRGDRV